MAHQNLMVYQNFIICHLKDIYIYISGWWFQPLWNILVSWDYYSQYVEKYKNAPNHQPYIYIYPIFRDIQMSANWRFRKLIHVSFRKMQNQTDEATDNKIQQIVVATIKKSSHQKTWHCDLSACKWISAATVVDCCCCWKQVTSMCFSKRNTSQNLFAEIDPLQKQWVFF